MHVDARQFVVQPSSGVPLFRQLMEQVHTLLAAGKLQHGDMLPSIRDLSAALDINMMTVSRAWSKLQDQGVVENVRGRGMRIVARPSGLNAATHVQDLQQRLQPLVLRAIQLGLSDQQIRTIIEQLLQEQRQ